MAQLTRIVISILTLLMCFGFVSARMITDRYKSTRLESLCSIAHISDITDTLANGTYYGQYNWEQYPLTICVDNGEVTHVGIQLFTSEYRNKMKSSPIYNFLERLLLEYHLGYSTSDLNSLKVDNISIEKGQLKTLHKVLDDTTLTLSWSLDNGRYYKVEWAQANRPWFTINFPASYRLLEGYVADEAVKRLSNRITNMDTTLRPKSVPDISRLCKCDSIDGDYFILKGKSCVLPIINNDRYYTIRDSMLSLIFSPVYPVESLANILITGEIANNYNAKVRMHVYGGKYEYFTIPLNSLINYFLNEGCTPYFGLKGIFPSQDRITALYEMVNESAGYEHLMSVSFDITTLPKRKGDIEMRLTPYIPTHDIKNLFR